VVVANPRQLRSVALGHGILEKSDPIDAAVIRRFGQDVRNLNLATPKSEDQEKHGALARRRKSLLEMINQEETRLKQTADPEVRGWIEKSLDSLKKQLKTVDERIKQMVAREAKSNSTLALPRSSKKSTALAGSRVSTTESERASGNQGHQPLNSAKNLQWETCHRPHIVE